MLETRHTPLLKKCRPAGAGRQGRNVALYRASRISGATAQPGPCCIVEPAGQHGNPAHRPCRGVDNTTAAYGGTWNKAGWAQRADGLADSACCTVVYPAKSKKPPAKVCGLFIRRAGPGRDAPITSALSTRLPASWLRRSLGRWRAWARAPHARAALHDLDSQLVHSVFLTSVLAADPVRRTHQLLSTKAWQAIQFLEVARAWSAMAGQQQQNVMAMVIRGTFHGHIFPVVWVTVISTRL